MIVIILITIFPQAHCHYWIVENFVKQVEKAESAAVTAVLTQLVQLYAVHGIVENSGDFLEVSDESKEMMCRV